MLLGSLIKTQLRRQGKSQKQVANAIGISTNAMSQICRDAVMPSKKTIDKICKELSVLISIQLIPAAGFVAVGGVTYIESVRNIEEHKNLKKEAKKINEYIIGKLA